MPNASQSTKPAPTSAPWYARASGASIPAKNPEMKRPKKDATAAGIGGSTAAVRSAITTASATPARIAGHRRRGIARFESIMRMYDVCLGKKKPIREAYADRWVRERCQIGINKCDDRSSLSKLTSSSLSWTSLQPSSLLALVNHLLLATHC
jgi:hypothetical protein